MTDIIIPAPITTHRHRLDGIHVPRLGIARAFENLIVVLSDAYGSLYALPFTSHRSYPPTYSSEELEGRDPTW